MILFLFLWENYGIQASRADRLQGVAVPVLVLEEFVYLLCGFLVDTCYVFLVPFKFVYLFQCFSYIGKAFGFGSRIFVEG